MGHEYFVTKKENLTDGVNFWDKFHKDLKEKKKKRKVCIFEIVVIYFVQKC